MSEPLPCGPDNHATALAGQAPRIISVNYHGASASCSKLMTEFGFTAETVATAAKQNLEAAESDDAPNRTAASRPQGPGDRDIRARCLDELSSIKLKQAHPQLTP